MSWITEHGSEYAVPSEITKAEGLVDLSWHNDACPSFGVDEYPDDSLRIWVEMPDPIDRESESDGRFVVNYVHYGTDPAPLPDASDGCSEIYNGNDAHDALTAFVGALRTLRAYRR